MCGWNYHLLFFGGIITIEQITCKKWVEIETMATWVKFSLTYDQYWFI
jgi:hypothetical protein